ncbi:hypothetical protein X975_04584, partial [Stegodyphus mimosarum]
MSFFITLISDSSMRFFRDYKISQFTTQLPTPIDLNSQWELSLVDFIYPHRWYNVRKDNNLFGFDLGDGKLEGRRVPPGCYETISDLLKAMKIPSHKNKIELSYHPVTKKVTIKTDENCRVILHEGLAELLGFEPGVYKRLEQSPFVVDPKVSFLVILEASNMRVPYTCCTKKSEDYYLAQTGNGLPYYQGTVLQKGYDSPDFAKSELDLFSLPPTQTVIEKGQWVEFHPLANVSEGSPVEFNVSGSGDDYLDLSQTQLYVKVIILKNDVKPITAESKVGPVNRFLHSIFSQVDISLNEKLVFTSNNTYPYRAMIEKLLNHGLDTKTSQLSSELFFKDTGEHMNVFDT